VASHQPKIKKTNDPSAACYSVMDSARLYRDRALQLRRLASTERDVSVRQQLTYHAIRFEEFAADLEAETEFMPRSTNTDPTGRA
jgi:hypothetical protein